LTELITLATAKKGKEKKKRHPNLRLFKDMDKLWNSINMIKKHVSNKKALTALNHVSA